MVAVPAGGLPESDVDAVVAACAGRFARLRGERIFVTGGTGFVGRWLIETLLAANERYNLGIHATLLSRDPAAFVSAAPHLAHNTVVEMLEGDIRSFVFPAERFDRVLHLAAETNVKLTDPDPEVYLDVIVGGTRRVLDFANHAGVRSLLLVSSGAVYGRPSGGGALSEDADSAPNPTERASAYGEAKRFAELLACDRARRSGLSATIARCFAFVGPYLPLDSGFAVGNFIRDALVNGEIVIHGDGTPRRSYLYASDMASWLWSIAIDGKSCRPYNVGSDEPVTIAQLAQLVTTATGLKVPVRILGDSALVGAGPAYVPDVARARAELALTVSVGIEDAIHRSVAWSTRGKLGVT